MSDGDKGSAKGLSIDEGLEEVVQNAAAGKAEVEEADDAETVVADEGLKIAEQADPGHTEEDLQGGEVDGKEAHLP